MSAYDIGCDEGTWNAFLRKMWCGAQALPYSFGKWMIGLTVALLDWMLAFQVAESLSPLAAALSNVYQTRLLGGLDVADLAWTLALFVGGWHLLRAKFSDGVREIATTFIIAVLGGIVLANPQGYLEGSITLARNASGTVLEAVDGALNDQPASDATAIRGQLAINLKQTFVAESYDLLNWNGPLTGECAVARDEILAGGPWGGDDRPREIMREHGCEAQAAFNEKPTDTRAFGSLAIGAVSGLVSALLIVLSVAVFVAQVTLIALFSGASVAWIVALFPGGRGILWWWLSRLVWAVLITFTSVFLLSWLAITLTVVLNATADVNLLQRSLIALVVVAAAFKFRSSVDRAIDGASARIAATMNSLTGPRGAAKPAAASATSGGGFQPMSWSPTQTALTAAAAGASIAGTAITVARTSAQRGRTVGSGAVRGGRRAGASALKGSKAIARAPVTIPQRIGQSRARTTQRAVDVRSRLDSARGRGQWARSARHPVAVAREAKEAAIKAQTDLSDWM
ncbi:MAG TPA: hypothetical protein VGJ86_22305 [Acidimicrobiales bacterium]|jgi:hypothetical protein